MMHLEGLSTRPAAASARAKIGKNFFRAASLRRAAPRSSAQARKIPKECEIKVCSNMYKNGSNATVKRNADAGHPCSTPERLGKKTRLLVWVNYLCLYRRCCSFIEVGAQNSTARW